MKIPVGSVVVLLALAVLPYAPGLRHGFVYDDHGAIVENRFFADRANVWDVVTLRTLTNPRVLDGQRPTLLLSMFLDRGAGGPVPWRFHATNVLLHAGATLLFFCWLRGLAPRGRDAPAGGFALAAAMIFALHPLLTEAVQLPSYREDLLFAFFLFAFLLAARVDRALLRWPLQAACLALAAGAKESVIIVPMLLGWMWWCFPGERPPRRAAAALLAGSIALVAGYAAFAYGVRPLQAAGGAWNGLALRWPENVWTAPWLWVRYLGLLVAPWPLVADRIVDPVPSPLAWRFLVGTAVLAGCKVAAWTLRRREPMVALGVGWMLLAFLPVSNLLPLYNPMADRYAYLMAPGFAMCLASLLVRPSASGPVGSQLAATGVAAAAPVGSPRRRLALPILAVAYVLLIQLRLADWRNDATLWTATARAEPRSARAQTWLGLEALNHGDRAAARARFARADALNPQDVTALVNLAILDGLEGDLAQATALLREAVQRRPDKAEAWANLAVALEMQGLREEALDAAGRARDLDLLGR